MSLVACSDLSYRTIITWVVLEENADRGLCGLGAEMGSKRRRSAAAGWVRSPFLLVDVALLSAELCLPFACPIVCLFSF